MSPELDEKLCKKYPKIFRDRYGDMRETCMCWGFECGDGWHSIIDGLCAVIQNEVNNNISSYRYKNKDTLTESDLSDEKMDEKFQVVAAQVKEKFGLLRAYFNNTNDYINGAISLAEYMSGFTCEDCGLPGERRRGPWIRTLCNSCDEKGKRRGKTG